MEFALTLVVVIAVAVAVSSLAGRLGVSAPLILIVVGIALSYVPFVPDVELTPEIVLVGLLPPLLYSAAIQTSLLDFTANRRPILLLSVGLVLFTTAGIGVLVHAVLPVSWPVAFALGAVVGPPDAVAAMAVAKRVGLPRQLVTILEGESLVNDATAIVTLRTAIAAIAGTVGVLEVGLSFLLSAVGGTLVGLLVAMVVLKLRRWIDDELSDVALSLLTPFVAYVGAEEVHLPGVEGHPSGVLAVVAAGLLLGHRAPIAQTATSRLFERTNWATISFVLENVVFLLIGMQIRDIVVTLGADDLSPARVAAASAGALVGVMVVRFVWIFAVMWLPSRIVRGRRGEAAASWQDMAVISWAGMRGVVTLAAVFLLPVDTEHRPALVMVAFVVTVGTLLIQGFTLPGLVRALRVEGPDRHEDHLQEASVIQAASRAGLAYVDEHESDLPESVKAKLRQRADDRTNAVWERLGGEDTPTARYSRARIAMLEAERQELLRIRGAGAVDQSILQRVLNTLDVEESIIDRAAEGESTAERESELRPADAEACEHLAALHDIPQPRTPQGCEECLAAGHGWVHLRLCMTCGHVGCCDSSPDRHASTHHAETGHPVMRSFEPGEAWRWCFTDHVTG